MQNVLAGELLREVTCLPGERPGLEKGAHTKKKETKTWPTNAIHVRIVSLG